MDAPLKFALSKRTMAVSPTISEFAPPITPATPTGLSVSQMQSILVLRARSVPSRVRTISFYAEGSDEVAYTATVTGSDVQEYSVDEVVAGTYTVVVSKANHATRTYTVVVGDADIEQELVIHLMGDITGDGKVNAIDTARANAHAKGTKALVDYELNCSDISGDGKVNAIDTARINAHAKGTKALWS